MARVLLIEDHPRLAALMRLALARAGIECDCVGTLDQAQAALQSHCYAAALVDRGVPDGDGLALVRRWRDSGQHLPCLVVTARDALHDRVEGLEAGADDYLCKPFPMAELVARVRALLRRPAQQVPTEPAFGDIRLLPTEAVLLCGEHRQCLPRAELQILQALLRAGGKSVRRGELEMVAWGLGEAVTPGALDVALHRLRRRLESAGSQVRIRNRRGVGYEVAV